ncbi:hypothetical protein KAR91_57965 [Candidatus Pacearchaeota archaeon]|nr:hypothetical protein [Candidatus Pacearchaeota archaeon]
MPIRYKVVKKRSRCSAVVNGNSPYGLKYLPGTTVTAKEETLGIMTFVEKYQAKSFAQHLGWSDYGREKCMVITVETIGRGKYPKIISSGIQTEHLDSFYFQTDSYWKRETIPPDGTMCYPAVKVLE